MDIGPLGNVVLTGSSAPPATGAGSPAPSPTTTGNIPTSPTPAVAPTQPEPSFDAVNQAAQKIKAAINAGLPSGQGIEFALDGSSHRIVVKVVDQQGQVIRQIPSKEALAIADSIDQSSGQTQGLLINQQA